MRLGISAYPSKDFAREIPLIWTSIAKAKEFGFSEVFSSLHITELDLDQQIDELLIISECVRQHQMKLCVDIGGDMIRKIILRPEYIKKISAMQVDSIRLDYGFSMSQLREIYYKLNIKHFVLNASVLSENEVDENVREIRAIASDIVISACHNFYVRPQSGITMDFLRKQYPYFKKHGIEVSAYVPSFNHPRPPLCRGLVTVEEHRYWNLLRACMQLKHCGVCDGILIGDSMATDEELEAIRRAIGNEPLTVRFNKDPNATDDEVRTVLKRLHKSRYDYSEYALRLETTRTMAEFAHPVAIRETRKRKVGDITIDNIGYQRYSGEVQIVIKDAGYDENVNIIGQVCSNDLWMLEYIKEGYPFYLVEEEKVL